MDRARVAPGRLRLMDMLVRERANAVDFLSSPLGIFVTVATSPVMQTVSILLVVVGDVVVVAGLGWLAMRSFYH